jgi:hypothetical protein
MAFRHMVDMTRTDEEKMQARYPEMPSLEVPDVHPGLCLCLNEADLERLDLEDNAEVGDLLHMHCIAKVTSVNKSDTGDGCKVRVEMSVIFMTIEDEDAENEMFERMEGE